MINTGFANALHGTGFVHRANFTTDGYVIYCLSDGSGSVRLPRVKWEAIGDRFAEESAAFSKRSRKLNLVLFPAILVFALTLGQLLPFTGLLILTGIFGGPLTIYRWHSRGVKRCAARAEARLTAFPRTAALETPVEKPPRVLQIAALIVGGPYLIVSLIGQIGGPDTFRNTPWTGAHIGLKEAVAFAVIALLVAWPRLAPRLFGQRRSD